VNFLLSITFGLIPVHSTKIKNNVKVIGIINAFSSGIFISIALLDLIPDSIEVFDKYYE